MSALALGLVARRVLLRPAFPLTILWCGLLAMALVAVGDVLRPDDGLSNLGFLAAAALTLVPAVLGLSTCQSLQWTEHLAFGWTAPRLHRANVVLLALGAVVAALAGWGVHALLGGPVGPVAALGWGLFAYAWNLGDLGWHGDRRARLLAWGAFVPLLGGVVFAGGLQAALVAWPTPSALLGLALTVLLFREHARPVNRRARVAESVVYLQDLFGRGAADPKVADAFGVGGRARGTFAATPPGDIATVSRRLSAAWDSAGTGGTVGRAFRFGIYCALGLLVAVGSGALVGGGPEGFRRVIEGILLGGTTGDAMHQFIVAYFGGVGLSLLLGPAFGPETQPAWLPWGRQSWRRWRVRRGRLLAALYAGSFGGLLALFAGVAALGAEPATWRPLLPAWLVVTLTIPVAMPWVILLREALASRKAETATGGPCLGGSASVGLTIAAGLLIIALSFLVRAGLDAEWPLAVILGALAAFGVAGEAWRERRA